MDSINHFKNSIFPDPNMADEDGLLCIGGHLTVRTLLDAYYHGIFPWPQEAFPILWFCPMTRGILEFKKLHIPKKLRQFRNNWKGEIRINTSFREVIKNCKSQKRPGQSGTWIIPQMIHSYTDLHKAGYAHSIEAWENEELVGGIYGVFIGNVFSGESMFYRKSNCSKLCLWHLTEHLQNIGLEWMDLQMLTPITRNFGGEYIPREEFLNRLQADHRKPEIVF
ncbi:MAG: leucyl/phenylalanyl-tRNA--protein transferase [Spirochaetes bacterium]|nr:leucyl/phenylalanyl-tRNA--protein transferase [Spirochaetota bacterium]